MNGEPGAPALLPRVAFCTDTFDEPNGVATIARHFTAFARREQLPFLLVRPGSSCRCYSEGSVSVVEIAKGRLCIPLDMGLRFDLRISRHFCRLKEQFAAFAPDIVHITGPGDIGMLSARLAHVLRTPKVPLVAGWHTNVHQYARLRATPLLRMLPRNAVAAVGAKIEAGALRAAARFYKTARLILAPNEEILSQLTGLTGKPGCLMPHGVDTDLFAPAPANPPGPLTLGYVGRLTPEKNVRFLADIARRLPEEIRSQVRFLIVGDGSERAWLEQHLPGACFTGVLRDGELARAYTSMHILLFPSQSETFGLVLLEAMSAGVPVVALKSCGRGSAVDDGRTGFIAGTAAEFAAKILELVRDADLRGRFREASRQAALRFRWDAVFQSVYTTYQTILPTSMPGPAAVATESAR